MIVYALFGTIIIFAFALWATDPTREWRRKPAYWDLDDHKNNTAPTKVFKLEDYMTGNRTRRFRGEVWGDLFSNVSG